MVRASQGSEGAPSPDPDLPLLSFLSSVSPSVLPPHPAPGHSLLLRPFWRVPGGAPGPVRGTVGVSPASQDSPSSSLTSTPPLLGYCFCPGFSLAFSPPAVSSSHLSYNRHGHWFTDASCTPAAPAPRLHLPAGNRRPENIKYKTAAINHWHVGGVPRTGVAGKISRGRDSSGSISTSGRPAPRSLRSLRHRLDGGHVVGLGLMSQGLQSSDAGSSHALGTTQTVCVARSPSRSQRPDVTTTVTRHSPPFMVSRRPRVVLELHRRRRLQCSHVLERPRPLVFVTVCGYSSGLFYFIFFNFITLIF